MGRSKHFLARHRVLSFTVFGIIGVLIVWLGLSSLTGPLFPGPQVVFPAFIELLGTKMLWAAIGGTLLRLFLAVLIGIVFGLCLGLLGGVSSAFRVFFKPFVIVLRTIPTAAVIFIIIALLEPALAPIIIVFLITFPILYEAVVTGLTSIDPQIKAAARVDGAGPWKVTFQICLPLSWSYILLGVVSSVGLGMKVSIMTEILSGSYTDTLPGIGHLFYVYSLTLETEKILALSLAAIILIGLIEIGLYFAKRQLSRRNGH